MNSTIRTDIELRLPEEYRQKLMERIKSEIDYFTRLTDFEARLRDFLEFTKEMSGTRPFRDEWTTRDLISHLEAQIRRIENELSDDLWVDKKTEDSQPHFSYFNHDHREGEDVQAAITAGEERINGTLKFVLRLLVPHRGIVVLCNDVPNDEWEYGLAVGFVLEGDGTISNVIYDFEDVDDADDVTLSHSVLEALEELLDNGRVDA